MTLDASRMVVKSGRSISSAPAGTGNREGRPAYAARVEEVERGIEHLRVLAEEGPPLLVEGLEDAEIEHRGIRLHLAEVGVRGAVEADVRGKSVADVGAEVAEVFAPVRVDRCPRPEDRAPDEVGPHLEGGFRGDVPDASQVPEAGYEPLVLHAEGDPERVLLEARRVAVDLQAPGRVGPGEAEVVERDAHLGGPALLADPGVGFEHPVPGVGFPVVVEIHPVDHRAARGDEEGVGGLAVVVGVEGEVNPVRLLDDPLIAPAEAGDDLVRLLVEADRSHVQGLVVVEEADLGALGRREALVREALGE